MIPMSEQQPVNKLDKPKHGPLYQCGWNDTPHLTDEMKTAMLSKMSPHLRDARTKGIPSVGSGQIFPISRDRYEVSPFPIPRHWPKAYGLDVGWNRTAGTFIAWDPDNDIIYVYQEHYQGKVEPSDHVKGITAHAGDWMWGAIDPAAAGSNQRDGRSLMNEYLELGLLLVKADNSVETGIARLWNRFVSGKLKIFSNCTNLLRELGLYKRNDKGRIVKANDHAVDALRYAVMTGETILQVRPDEDEDEDQLGSWDTRRLLGGASSITGY